MSAVNIGLILIIFTKVGYRMQTMEIYKNYGVLGSEKISVYSFDPYNEMI